MPFHRTGRPRAGVDELVADLLSAVGKLPPAAQLAAWRKVDGEVIEPAARGTTHLEVDAAVQRIGRQLFGRLV